METRCCSTRDVYNAPYDRLDVVFDALIRSNADRAILAVDHYRGIHLPRIEPGVSAALPY
jgi:hypothetical protein